MRLVFVMDRAGLEKSRSVKAYVKRDPHTGQIIYVKEHSDKRDPAQLRLFERTPLMLTADKPKPARKRTTESGEQKTLPMQEKPQVKPSTKTEDPGSLFVWAEQEEKGMKFQVQTPSGTHVEITLLPGPSHFGGAPYIDWSIPAKGLSGRGSAVCRMTKVQNGANHYIDSKPALGLGNEAAQTIFAAVRAYKLKSPEGQREALRKEREDLQHEIAGWWDAMSRAREKAFDKDTGAGWGKAKEYEAKAEATKVKMAAFDAAHPEIIAKLKAEKEERTARFRASN